MDRTRNGIRAALVRLLRIYDREVALDNALRGIGQTYDNYHFDNWAEIVDAICYMTGDTTDKMLDSQTYKILQSSLDKSRKVELLMGEYDEHAKPEVVQPAPNIMDPEEVRNMARQNGYRAVEYDS